MTPATEHLIEVIVSAIVSIVGTLGAKKGFDKTAKRKAPPIDEGTKQLIIELRRQLNEVKAELKKERRDRLEDSRKHQQQLDKLNRELGEARTTIAVLKRDARLLAGAPQEGDEA